MAINVLEILGSDDMYIVYTPNLGLGIVVLVRDRGQGRFRGSSEGARETEGALWGSAIVLVLLLDFATSHMIRDLLTHPALPRRSDSTPGSCEGGGKVVLRLIETHYLFELR